MPTHRSRHFIVVLVLEEAPECGCSVGIGATVERREAYALLCDPMV